MGEKVGERMKSHTNISHCFKNVLEHLEREKAITEGRLRELDLELELINMRMAQITGEPMMKEGAD